MACLARAGLQSSCKQWLQSKYFSYFHKSDQSDLGLAGESFSPSVGCLVLFGSYRLYKLHYEILAYKTFYKKCHLLPLDWRITLKCFPDNSSTDPHKSGCWKFARPTFQCIIVLQSMEEGPKKEKKKKLRNKSVPYFQQELETSPLD